MNHIRILRELWQFNTEQNAFVVKLMSFFFVFIPTILISQNELNRELFLDSLFNETSQDHAHYIRIIQKYSTIQNEYWIYQYYASGELQMKGKTLSRDRLIEKGEFDFYYRNGMKSEQINYENGVRRGTYLAWYENGSRKTEGSYLKSSSSEDTEEHLRIDQYWDECSIPKVVDGNGIYHEEDIKYEVSSSGPIVNGLKHGVWSGKSKVLQLSFVEEYDNGTLSFGTSTTSDKIYHYKKILEKGLPKRGLIGFYNFANLQIQKTTLVGKLQVSFYANPSNKISNFRILQSNSEDLEILTNRMVIEYPRWDLDTYRGVSISTYYNFPVKVSNRKYHP